MTEQLSRKDLITVMLLSFKITTYDFEEIKGTSVTLYKFRPQIGVRVSRILGLKNELAATLGVPSVRIIAPMEDGSVGIEVPNQERDILPLDTCIGSETYQQTTMTLPCCLGLSVSNEVFMADLAEMPHLLVAGATGQGKSVGLNVMLMSLMHKLSPEQLKFVLIDPKQVEFSIYENYPQSYFANLGLNDNICTDTEAAEQTLSALCRLMEQRYSLLRKYNVRNIKEYNQKSDKKLPYVVVVVDEYGDLVMTAGREVEKSICRIAQKARAVGIHMIISTQRPSATIVTGNIKANFPVRIAFRTTTGTDSRVIIDRNGAEKLTGRGDMLYCEGADMTRVQGAYVDTDYIYNFRDELSQKYENLENPSLFIEEVQEQPKRQQIFLSQRLFTNIEALAHKVADYKEVSTEMIRKLVGGGYHTEVGEMLIQLNQLGIVSKPDFWYGGKCTVIVRDHDRITEIINEAKSLEPDL